MAALAIDARALTFKAREMFLFIFAKYLRVNT